MGKQITLTGAKAPVLNRDGAVSDVFGADDGVRFYQDGHYFTGNGQYKYTDEDAFDRVKERRSREKVLAEVTQAQVAAVVAERIVTEDELPDLMARQEAKELLKFSVPQLREMTAAAGGPDISGENAQQLMAGWLIKFTV